MLKQYGESGEIDIGQVAEDAMVGSVVGGLHINFTQYEMLGENTDCSRKYLDKKTRDAEKKYAMKIKASDGRLSS